MRLYAATSPKSAPGTIPGRVLASVGSPWPRLKPNGANVLGSKNGHSCLTSSAVRNHQNLYRKAKLSAGQPGKEVVSWLTSGHVIMSAIASTTSATAGTSQREEPIRRSRL